MLDRNEKTSKSFDLKACKKDIENHRLRGAFIFFHPDYTVGTGISPVPANVLLARGLYRRSGISPCPED